MTIRLDTPDNGFTIDWLGQQTRLPFRCDDTSGRLHSQLVTLAADSSNPPHVHTCEPEVFYVIDGELHLRVGSHSLALRSGDLAYAPPGLPHQIVATGDRPATVLVLLTGESIEKAFVNASGGDAAAVQVAMTGAGVELLDEFDPAYRPARFDHVTDHDAIVRRAGEGQAVWLAGDTYTILLEGADTGDQLTVVHFDIPPGGGPLPHLHTRDFEAFVILSGEVELYADGDIVTGRPGDVAVLPENIPHCFKNRTTERAEMLAVLAPSGFDEFIRRVGQPAESGQDAPPIDDAEKQRLIATAPEFGVVLRPDIEF